MTIKELKEYIDTAHTNGEQGNVEFWLTLDDESCVELYLDNIGQFNVIPDMVMELRPMNEDQKIYTTKILDEKQFDYRSAYLKLVQEIKKLRHFEENIFEEDQHD